MHRIGALVDFVKQLINSLINAYYQKYHPTGVLLGSIPTHSQSLPCTELSMATQCYSNHSSHAVADLARFLGFHGTPLSDKVFLAYLL